MGGSSSVPPPPRPTFPDDASPLMKVAFVRDICTWLSRAGWTIFTDFERRGVPREHIIKLVKTPNGTLPALNEQQIDDMLRVAVGFGNFDIEGWVNNYHLREKETDRRTQLIDLLASKLGSMTPLQVKVFHSHQKVDPVDLWVLEKLGSELS